MRHAEADRQHATTCHRPQLLIAVENSPPNVTPNLFCDTLVAMAQALRDRISETEVRNRTTRMAYQGLTAI